MIELAEVNYKWPNAERPLWDKPLSVEVIGPARIWLKGANGTGKLTLIDLICGVKSPIRGNCQSRRGENRAARPAGERSR